MSFYKQLSKLLTKTNEISNLANLKNVMQFEKEKKYKSFIEILINFYKCEIKTEESKKFKKYWIEYLKGYIINSISFSSLEEKKEIEIILKENDSKQVNNININFIDMKNKNSENYEIKSLGSNYIEDSNNEPIDFVSKINTNYNNDKIKYINQINFKLNDLNRNNKINNINPSNEINKDKIDFAHNHNNVIPVLNQNEEVNQKKIQKENKKNQLKMNVHSNNKNNEDHINDYNYLKNENIAKDNKIKNMNINVNNIVINKKNNINIQEKKKDIKINKNEIRDDNCYNIENADTSMSSYGNNKTNINIKVNDKVEANNIEDNKKDKNDIKIKKIISNNDNKKKEVYEQKIDYFYKTLLKNNTTLRFIKFATEKIQQKIMKKLNDQIFSLIDNNRNVTISQIWKEKLITLICVLFPFAKGQNPKINEKEEDIFKTEDKVDKNLFKYLRTNILIPDETNTRDDLFKLSQDKMDNVVKKFCSNLYLSQDKEGKSKLFSIYTFLIITRNFRKFSKDSKIFEDLLAKEYLISFKIRFILEHQEFYSEISKDIVGVYNGLLFINIFYNEIFGKGEGKNEYHIIKKDDKIGKYILGDNKFELTLDRNCDFNIDKLFSEKDNLLYKKVMENISHFYSINQIELININDLIYFSTSKIQNKESNFIINLLEHIYEKEKYIYNNFENYKNNLQKLEKCIYSLGAETLNLQKNNTQIKNYVINDTQRKVFKSLIKDIEDKIDPKLMNKFGLYPYGSVTQFLGGQKSDIDVYLYIKDNSDKVLILKKLCSAINKIIGKRAFIVISRRLCIIKFKYKSQYCPETDFDISLMGFCPYLHSVLLRTYSLIDPRFSLLAITLKKFLGFLGLKGQEDKPDFLNSFSWMILLVAFLQDIIKPKILPKILSNKSNSFIPYKIQYGNNDIHDRSFEKFVSNIKEEITQFIDSLYDKNLLKSIYLEEIGKNEKNNMSCAEIFLSFLEYLLFIILKVMQFMLIVL